jgi:hypothetical protein
VSKLIRSANDWTINELKAYIAVVHYNAATFESSDLPEPTVSSEAITALDAYDAVDDRFYELLLIMGLIMSVASGEESAVTIFAVLLLRALGYTRSLGGKD